MSIIKTILSEKSLSFIRNNFMIHVKRFMMQHKIYIPLTRRRILFVAQSSRSKSIIINCTKNNFQFPYKFSFDYYYVAKYFSIYYLQKSPIDITNCGFLIPEKSYTKRLKIMIMYIFVISIILFLALNISLITTNIILPIYKEYCQKIKQKCPKNSNNIIVLISICISYHI